VEECWLSRAAAGHPRRWTVPRALLRCEAGDLGKPRRLTYSPSWC